jgi:hypothetical protein
VQWSKIKTLTSIMCILSVALLSGCTKKNSQALTPPEPLILVDNGVCNVSIHNIPTAAPSTVETFAAEELQTAFELACGIAPKINPVSPAKIEIRLGVAGQFSKSVGNENEQAYAIHRTNDGNIELIGNCKAAVMWAVDDFCKEVLHVSWPINTDVMMLQGKPQSTVIVGQLCKVDAPDFPVRGWLVAENIDGYHYSDTIGKWMAHNRMNAVQNLFPRMEEGGGYKKMLARGLDVDTTMHDLAWLIPRELYDEHPEYFPLIDGERVKPGPDNISVQRCTSDPDVRNIIIDKIKQGFIDYPDLKVFGVGHNDSAGGRGWCECDNCVAMDGAQAETGARSNRYTEFTNYLANVIAPTHPGKYIGTFAYGRVRTPPDIDIADNVAITYVFMGGNYMRKITDPCDPRNVKEMATLKGWLDKSDNVHFWTHYWTSDMDSCFAPYARTVIEGFKDLKKLGFRGFIGQTYPYHWPSQRIFFYAIARASWDNSVDFDKVLDDYCNEAFGPAASAMKSYYLLYEDRIYEHVPYLTRDGACAQLFPPAFSSADMDALESYITTAEAAAAKGGFGGNIDAVTEMRQMFDRFKAISTDPRDIPGIGPNLIVNPGAEDGQSPWAWDVLYGSGDYSFTIATDAAYSGDNSFKIECTGKGGWARWLQSVGEVLTPGKKYAASFWIRADNNGAPGIVEFYMPKLTRIGWQDSNDKWVRIVVPELTATGTNFNIYPSMDGRGYVYFDDFFLAELP